MATATTMTIATNLGTLVQAEPALAKLTTVKLDAKARYHAVKLRTLVAAETKHYAEQRDELIRELGVSREPTSAERAKFGPDPVHEVTAENLPEFRRRLADLLEVPVVINWGPVTGTMLEPYPDVTGDDMLALGPLFELE